MTTLSRPSPSKTSEATDPIKVLYIGGLGRSGSTLVGRLMGGFPGYVHVGEINAIWERWFTDAMRCGCGQPFCDCAFWSDVYQEAFGPRDPKFITHVIDLKSRLYRRENYFNLMQLSVPRLRTDFADSAKAQRYSALIAEYGGVLTQLYRAVAVVSGAHTIVDISKSPWRAYLLNASPDIDLRFVHLVRDSRAVAFSWRRRKLTPSIVRGDAHMLRQSWIHSAIRWSIRNLVCHLRSPCPRAIRLRYEDIVSGAEGALTQVFHLLDEPLPSLDFLRDRPIRQHPQHTVAGNPHRFDAELIIEEDIEWRSAMPWAAKALVSAATFPLMAYYGYFTPSRRSPPSSAGERALSGVKCKEQRRQIMSAQDPNDPNNPSPQPPPNWGQQPPPAQPQQGQWPGQQPPAQPPQGQWPGQQQPQQGQWPGQQPGQPQQGQWPGQGAQQQPPPYGQQAPPYGQAAPPYGQQPTWPPPPNQYGAPAGGFYPEQVKANEILGIAIASFFCLGIILGPWSIIRANNAIAAMDAGRADPTDRGKVVGARVCGIITTTVVILAIIAQAGLRLYSGANGSPH